MYKFSEKEVETVQAVFESLIKKDYDELNTFLGSVTIEEMGKLYRKIKYNDYCERHGIRYEDMTDDDFANAYQEMEE